MELGFTFALGVMLALAGVFVLIFIVGMIITWGQRAPGSFVVSMIVVAIALLLVIATVMKG